MRLRVQEIRIERARLALRLAALPGVRRVYPSQGNFLLVRFAEADAACARLLAAGVVVRDMRQLPPLGDALRNTIGTPVQNAVGGHRSEARSVGKEGVRTGKNR